MTTMTDDVLFAREGASGRITLNRPKALNALNLPMIHALREHLVEWSRDPAIKGVVLTGAGDRAFCAGGDIRSLYDVKQAGGGPLLADFFWHEYRLNRQIHRYAKPYISLIDGICMGGGVGLSVHAPYRVASEKATFAMPETGIGFFPDVGGGYALGRCPGEIGVYLALTGARLKLADAIYAGLATHHVPSAEFPALLAALADAPNVATIQNFARDAGLAPLAEQREVIDRCFAHDAVEAIFVALAADGSDFAAATLKTLKSKSPLSLKVTLKQVQAARLLGFEDAMIMEYRIVQRFMAGREFFEGVRAVLVDKDNAPRWSHTHPEDVTAAEVDAYFAKLPRDLDFN